MGAGVCVADNATCACFKGYTGHFCEQCAPGYHLTARETCEPSADPCQSLPVPCSSNCTGHGNCTDEGACECDAGAFGRQCAERGCPDTWSRDECHCCPSGVLAATGECCAEHVAGVKPVLDINGSCCGEGYIDACGVLPCRIALPHRSSIA